MNYGQKKRGSLASLGLREEKHDSYKSAIYWRYDGTARLQTRHNVRNNGGVV